MLILKNNYIKILVIISIILFSLFGISVLKLFQGANIPNVLNSQIQLKQEIKFLPFPYVQLTQIIAPENKTSIFTHNIKGYFSLLSLLTLSPKISKIEIDKIDIFDDNLHFDEYPNATYLLKILKSYKESFNDFTFHIASLVVYNQDLTTSNVTKVHYLNNLIIESQKITFNTDNKLINFSIEDNKKLISLITSQGYELKSLSEYSQDAIVNSKFNLKITDLTNFFSEIFSPKTSNKIQTQNTITSHAPILASWNTKLSEDNNEILENFIINSPDITLTANGTVNKSEVPSYNVNVESLNLTNFFQNLSLSDQQRWDLFGSFINKISFNNLSIAAKEIILANDKIINFKLITSVKKDRGYLIQQDILGEFASGGNFIIQGLNAPTIDFNSFNGKIALSYSNIEKFVDILGFKKFVDFSPNSPLEFYSDIALKDYALNFNNLSLKVNNTTNVTGKLVFRKSDPKSYIISDLNFSSLDLTSENFNKINTNLVQLISGFIPYKGSSSYNDSLVSLKNLNYTLDNQWHFDELKLVNHKLLDFTLAWNIKDGAVSLYNVNCMLDENNIVGSILFDSNSMTPNFVSDFKIDKVEISNPVDVETIAGTINSLQNDVAIDKLNMNATAKINELILNKEKFTDISFTANTQENTILIQQLSAKYLNSTLNVNANINSDPMSLNLAFSYDGLTAKTLSTYSSSLINFSDGAFSVAGLINTKGKKLNELLYNSQMQLDFIGSNLVYPNSGIDNFVTLISDDNYNISNFKSDLNTKLFYGDTKISSSKGRLLLDKGMFTLEKSIFNTNKTTTTIDGNLNIYDQSLNISILSKFYLSDTTNNNNSIQPANSTQDLTIIKLNLSNNLSNIITNLDSGELYNKLNSRNSTNKK